MRGAERAGELHAVVHRRVAQRDERDDVDGADPRVLAAVLLHVDVGDGLLHEPLQARGHGVVLAGDGEHRAVVAGVRGAVEQEDAGDRGQGVGEPLDHVEATALGDVGHAFDEHVPMLQARAGAGGARARAAAIRRDRICEHGREAFRTARPPHERARRPSPSSPSRPATTARTASPDRSSSRTPRAARWELPAGQGRLPVPLRPVRRQAVLRRLPSHRRVRERRPGARTRRPDRCRSSTRRHGGRTSQRPHRQRAPGRRLPA